MAACSSARHWRRSLLLYRRLAAADAGHRGALGAWRVALEGPLDLATYCDVTAQGGLEVEELGRMAVEVLKRAEREGLE